MGANHADGTIPFLSPYPYQARLDHPSRRKHRHAARSVGKSLLPITSMIALAIPANLALAMTYRHTEYFSAGG